MDTAIIDKELQQTNQQGSQPAPTAQVPTQGVDLSTTDPDREQVGQSAGQTGPVVQPAGTPSRKEQAPIQTIAITEASGEIVESTQPEITITSSAEDIKIPEALKNFVELGQDKVQKLPKAVQEAGVTLAKDATPVAVVPSGKVVLPMKYDDAVLIQKNKKVKMKEAIKWLAAQIAYLWRREDPNLHK